jgi:hypothetical protein
MFFKSTIKKIIFNRARKQAIALMSAEGFKCINKDPRPIPEAEATILVETVDDKTIEEKLPQELMNKFKDIKTQDVKGGLGDGKIIEALENFIVWLGGHTGDILAIAKLIIEIISMFGEKDYNRKP